jgi:hypothetical protein
MQDYWNALERLRNNKPIILPKGSLINKDTVALEAGRLRGSIKKSRESFSPLISAIEQARLEIPNQDLNFKIKIISEREQKNNYRELYHQSLNRELMLLHRLANLEKQLKRYGNVTPIV